MLVFVPVSPQQLTQLAAGESLAGPVAAYAPGPRVAEALGYPADWDEETERAVLLFASVDALARHRRRLVAVAEAPAATPGADPESGQVQLPNLAWSQVSAVFADAPEAAAAVELAAPRAAGLDLDAAWELPEVNALVTDHDLLWFGPSEAGSLVAPSRA